MQPPRERAQERAAAQGIEPNGFSFEGMDAAGLDYALNRAMSAWYNDRSWWNALARRIMLRVRGLVHVLKTQTNGRLSQCRTGLGQGLRLTTLSCTTKR